MNISRELDTLLKKVEKNDSDTQYITAGGAKIIELKLLKKD
jgi:hypothetical protein